MLRRHRHAARLTLEHLSEASGISVRSLSDLERGRSKGPQQRTITAIADALGLENGARKELIDLAREARLGDHWARPSGVCELPRSVEDFTGRTAEVAWVSELAGRDAEPGAAGVGLITGAAGLGKTTLVIRAAHLLRPGFPDGVLFLDLFGMSAQPLAAVDALAMLLRALGVAEQRMPADLDGRSSLLRSLLAERRVLLVLDNAASEEQVRPLLPGGGPARALVTSRRLLAGLEGGRRLSLRPLPLPEATELLAAIVSERAADDGPAALTQLAELCGGLPLAVRIVGNRLVSRPGWDAAGLAARLTSEERRLAQLKAGDLQIANAFGMSYEQVPAQGRRVFRRLFLIPGRDFDAALAAVVGGLEIEDAWDALDELVDLGLLHDSATGRYRFHDLVRLFARERLHAEDSQADQQKVTDTMIGWLLRMATSAGRWFEPAHGPPEQPEPGLASLEEAEHWLRVNVDNWLGAMRLAAERGRHAGVLDCAESMHWFSDRWMHGPHWQEVFTLGERAAQALGDTVQQATQLNYLAWVQMIPPVIDPEAALGYASRAQEVASGADSAAGATMQIAWAHQYTATALRKLKRLAEAAEAAQRAARMFKAAGDVDAYCQVLLMYGDCLFDDQRPAEALEQYRLACDLLDSEHMTASVAAGTRPHALGRVGHTQRLLGHHEEAITTLTMAAALHEQVQASSSLAYVLQFLAASLADTGRQEESRRTYTRAAEVWQTVGDTEAADCCRVQAAG
ncbi:helix-turn-helix domain-containing protein [Nonomuraea sp. NPDC049655]|uniref:helix-turn-helix domain-containing protein n=1 Tax=Nonomuraea sp. NPDC049655 TaxID=3364355 RepID=UPI00378883EB